MSRFEKILVFPLLLVVFAACQSPKSAEGQTYVVSDSLRESFPYQLNNPVRTFELPPELAEVSGMTFANDSSLFLIQDEIGQVFRMDLQTGETSRHIKFAGNGDFEDITTEGDNIWVMKSNGKLYRFSQEASQDADDEKWQPMLPEDADYESFCYLPCCQKLLAMGKEPVEVEGEEHDWQRVIFEMNLEDPTQPNIFHIINLKEVEAYLATYAAAEGTEALRERFDPEKKKSFKPSAMAIHPETGNIYVLASVGKILIVLSPEGSVLHVRPLAADLFPQPEGMCFGPDGTFYISHEGVNDKARVHVFPPANVR